MLAFREAGNSNGHPQWNGFRLEEQLAMLKRIVWLKLLYLMYYIVILLCKIIELSDLNTWLISSICYLMKEYICKFFFKNPVFKTWPVYVYDGENQVSQLWVIFFPWSSHVCMPTKSLQVCPALCNPTDHSPPGSSVHGVLLATILESVAMFSLVTSQPRDWSGVSDLSCIGRRVLYQ